MAQAEQNLKNHTRFDPAFHGFLTFGALLLLIASVVGLVITPDWWGALRLFGVIWLIVLLFKTRLYALKVQDRVIRLEERLRLRELLPQTVQSQIGKLTEGQLIALRFASDAEVPELFEKTLSGNLDQKQIKGMIKQWRPDYWRV